MQRAPLKGPLSSYSSFAIAVSKTLQKTVSALRKGIQPYGLFRKKRMHGIEKRRKFPRTPTPLLLTLTNEEKKRRRRRLFQFSKSNQKISRHVSPQSPKTQLQGGGTAQDPSPSFQCPIFLLAHPPFPALCTDSCLCACESVLYAQSPQELTPNPTTILPLREREGRDEPYSTITSNPSFLRPFDLLR